MKNQVILNFIAAINSKDIILMHKLMSDDHTFIDAYGNKVIGKDTMLLNWKVYFQWFPDYRIDVSDILSNENTFAIFGTASGTYLLNKRVKENYWNLPVAWKAIIAENKVQHWQVYADTKIPFDIIERSKKSQKNIID